MRSFTLVSAQHAKKNLRQSGGRYLSNTPSAAAKKAFSQVCQSKSCKRSNYTMIVEIRETTQGSKKKHYSYKVSRISDIRDVLIDGEMIEFLYTTQVKSLN